MTATSEDPSGSGIVHHEHALELTAGSEVVARVGRELSEPELRYVLERLQRA